MILYQLFVSQRIPFIDCRISLYLLLRLFIWKEASIITIKLIQQIYEICKLLVSKPKIFSIFSEQKINGEQTNGLIKAEILHLVLFQ